jgi:hypothetical protein
MKRKYFFAVALICTITLSYAQQSPSWDKWNSLVGEWIGEGTGKPGQGGGFFTFSFDLDKKILIRKGHTEFPASDTKPKSMHNDMMVIYPDYSGSPVSAIYFDNEGHTINYKISYSENSIILTSVKTPGVPIFRLTYTMLGKGTVNTKFEMSNDGEAFNTYIEGKSFKTN